MNYNPMPQIYCIYQSVSSIVIITVTLCYRMYNLGLQGKISKSFSSIENFPNRGSDSWSESIVPAGALWRSGPFNRLVHTGTKYCSPCLVSSCYNNPCTLSGQDVQLKLHTVQRNLWLGQILLCGYRDRMSENDSLKDVRTLQHKQIPCTCGLITLCLQ